MNELLETIINSLKELIGSGVKILPGLLTALILILLTRYAAQFIRQLATQVGKRTVRSKSLQLLLSKTCYITVWVVGVLIACVAAFPGLRLGDIIATLGLGSVAIGFAFQDIFKNFLAGILLLLQEPFRIQDQVIIGDYEGTVERIDIRTTKIRTYTGEQVLLPNATVFTSAVQVRTAFNSRRTDLAVGVDYNTVQQLSSSYQTNPTAVQSAMSIVGNYTRSALRKKRSTQGEQQAQQMINQFGGTQPSTQAVQMLFSAPQIQQIVQEVGSKTGINSQTVQRMLPLLVPLVLNFLKTGTNSQNPLGSNSVLSGFLDADGDGDVDIADAMQMATRYLNR